MKAQIVLENIGVRYPNRVLFENVNWTLYEGMRVTLAGRNGCGKSTLMRILAGQGEANEGNRAVVGGNKLRIGYLDQALLDSAVLQAQKSDLSSVSVIDYIRDQLLTEKDEHIEYDFEIKRVLSGLGFSAEVQNGSPQKLSGGWLLRMFIGATLLNQPQILFLDEPTNHLDLGTIQWLENFLIEEYRGTLVLISHDVALQRRTTDSLAILHGGHFYFRTHQRDYITFKESLVGEAEILERSIERNVKKHEELMDFVYRFRAKANTAARAQSKQKAADQLLEEITELKDRLQRIRGASYNLRFQFRNQALGGKFPLVMNDVSFRYSDKGPWISRHVNLEVKRGQKVAIIGDNGAGKTTLLKLMAQVLQPVEGQMQTGHNVDIGFFGQHQLDELMLDASLTENLRERAKGVGIEQIRSWLGAFGFSGEYEISKLAKVLSGGERARLALLRILVTPVNLVLLDEPTNHLDIETKELLKDAIRSFEGTIIFISHDREFISGLAERILYFSHDHQLTDHIGDLNSFFQKYPHLTGEIKPAAPAPKPVKKEEVGSGLSFEERKKLKNRLKSLERKIPELESSIESLGEQKEQLQKQLDDKGLYEAQHADKRNELFNQMTKLEQDLTQRMTEWEKLSSEFASLKGDGGD